MNHSENQFHPSQDQISKLVYTISLTSVEYQALQSEDSQTDLLNWNPACFPEEIIEQLIEQAEDEDDEEEFDEEPLEEMAEYHAALNQQFSIKPDSITLARGSIASRQFIDLIQLAIEIESGIQKNHPRSKLIKQILEKIVNEESKRG